MSKPDFLYHYTSIESLAMILKNRTIRFNKLSKTDDLEESMTGDLNNIGRFIYVSCWTNNSAESIPLWHIYSEKLSGVRIKLPFIPFKNYVNEYYNDSRFSHGENLKSIDDVKIKLYLPFEYLNNNLCHFLALFKYDDHDNKFEVQYTDDNLLIKPNVLLEGQGQVRIDFGNVGKYKRACWAFQEEWRYRIQAIPLSVQKYMDSTIGEKEIQNCINKIVSDYEIPLDHIDLVIDDEAFMKMEVTKGPGMTIGQELLLDAIMKMYNKDAKISDSSLKGKIKNKGVIR